jgi:hypothetical protein
MTFSIRLAATGLGWGLTLALSGVASAQTGDTGYCQALASKYQRYVVGTSGSGKMATPNVSVETASAKCGSNPAGSIPVLEKALTDARIDLPPRS